MRARKAGEFPGVEVGFEVELDAGGFGDPERLLQNFEDDFLLVFGADARLIDEGDDEVVCVDAGGGAEEGAEEALAAGALVVGAPDQGKVHEPVAADGGGCDAVLLFEGDELFDARVGGEGIGGGAVIVIDPLDVVEAGFAGAREFAAPRVAREGLEAAVFRWGETALHDAVLGHGSPVEFVGASLKSEGQT